MKNLLAITLLFSINASYAQVRFNSYEIGVKNCYRDLEKSAQELIDQGVCDLTTSQIRQINNGAGISSLNLSSSQKADVENYCKQMGKLWERLSKEITF